MNPTRRATIVTLATWLAGCGGGGGGSDVSTPRLAGSLQTKSLTAQANGLSYPLSIYLPPDDGTPRHALSVVYLLDGESRFLTTVDLVEASRTRVILVGIGFEAYRSHDYVPFNSCTPNGGGEGAFLDFIRFELIPYIDATVGGNPARRALLGHSHGGSFVLYALYAEAPGSHRFSAYLASDASIGCMPGYRPWLGRELLGPLFDLAGSRPPVLRREPGEHPVRRSAAGTPLRRARAGEQFLRRRPHRA